MKILQFTAENIKKLKVVSIKPDGSLVLLTGANGQGKSSVLDAIFMALDGKRAIPSTPVRHGEEKAFVKLDFGEIVVTRKFTANGGTSLTVEAANGAKFASPQAMLDGMLGALTFDPLEFARMKPKEQLDSLREIVKLPVDIDAVDAAITRGMDTRRVLKQSIELLRAKLPIVPDNTPSEPISVLALSKQLDAVSKHNANLAATLAGLTRTKEENIRLGLKIQELQQTIQFNQDLIDATEKQYRGMTVVDTDDLVKQIESAETTNKNVTILVQHKALTSEIADKSFALTGSENAIEGNRALRHKTLSEAKFPVDGLSFGEGEILYNGIPFAQLATGEQIRISLSIAMEANPAIRIIRIKEGSLLDEGNLAMIEMMAIEKDFQIWVEKVDTSGTVGIVIEDGSIVQSA